MITSIMNLLAEKKGFGSIIKVWLLTLLVLTICTCSGVKSTLVNRTFANQIDYSISFGRLAKPMYVHMDCATLRTEDLDFHLWHQARWLTWQPYPLTLDMEYYRNLDLMRRRCSRIKWYQYQSTIRSFSSQYKTVWTGQRQNLPLESQPQNTPVRSLKQTKLYASSTGSTLRSTGKTRATTRMTVRNSSSSSTMRAVNGNVRRTSSTTGVSRKRVYD